MGRDIEMELRRSIRFNDIDLNEKTIKKNSKYLSKHQ